MDVELVKNIRSIGIGRGFHTIEELKKILHDYYDTEISIVELEKILVSLDLFSGEDLVIYKNGLLANCQAHLINLNYMSLNAKYENQRIKAVDSYFKNASEMVKLISICRNKPVVKLNDVPVVELEDDDVEFKFEGEKEEKE